MRKFITVVLFVGVFIGTILFSAYASRDPNNTVIPKWKRDVKDGGILYAGIRTVCLGGVLYYNPLNTKGRMPVFSDITKEVVLCERVIKTD